MTRQEFLDYAFENNSFNKCAVWKEKTYPEWGLQKRWRHEPYDRTELEREIHEKYIGEIHPEKILDFFENVGRLFFERTETVSGDVLMIDIRWQNCICRWEDINAVVVGVGDLENCSDLIKGFYMSENGKFYDYEHTLLADTEEQFFDYLTTVEFDFHPVIAERTYEMLRFFGWYEGRRVDTTDFEREMRRRGIELTQKQLDFLSEFSGLNFSFKDIYYDWWFYTLDEVLQDNSRQLRTGYEETVTRYGEIVAFKSLVCGDSVDCMVPISVDSEGRLLRGDILLGRNAIESINHLANDAERDSKWQEIEAGQKMTTSGVVRVKAISSE